MKFNHKTNNSARGGLTLIELVVVLVVLVALAGILVPLLPNMITRSHAASGATSMQEATKAIQLFEAVNLRHPDGWDSLVSSGGATLRPERFTVLTLPSANSSTLEGRIRGALISAGISTSFTMADGIVQNSGISTFEPYVGDQASPNGVENLGDGGRVVILGGTADDTTNPGETNFFANEFNRFGFAIPTAFDNFTPPGGFGGAGGQAAAFGTDPTTAAYVVLGIGNQLSAVGKTMSAAPVHFPEAGDAPPTQAYARFVAIYRIPADGPAELATVAAVHGNHLDSINAHLKEFYETVQ